MMFCYHHWRKIGEKVIDISKTKNLVIDQIKSITLKVYSLRCACEHCCALFLHPNSNIFRILIGHIHFLLGDDDYMGKYNSCEIPNEKIGKIMAFSKIHCVHSPHIDCQNFSLDIDNVRSYIKDDNFYLSSIKIPQDTLLLPFKEDREEFETVFVPTIQQIDRKKLEIN